MTQSDKTRTMLANTIATAAADWLAYTGAASARAAIPGTSPQAYVVAGTPAAIADIVSRDLEPAAATMLTDERIDALAKPFAGMGGVEDCRAFARSVLAHAGVTEEPARIAAEIQGMADCMDMVRQELIEVGVIDASVAPMFIANAVVSKLQERATISAQAPAADEVRAAVLEEAAAHITRGNDQVRDNGWIDCANERARCAAAIRALAHQSTANSRSAEKGGA